VRLPDPRYTDLPSSFLRGTLQIFVHEGARQRWSAASPLPTPAVISRDGQLPEHDLPLARRRGSCWRASTTCSWTRLAGAGRRCPLRWSRRERAASIIVSRFIRQNGFRIRRASGGPAALDAGEVHDLTAIFRLLNETYFGNAVDALITGAGRVTAKAASSAVDQAGGYSATERLIGCIRRWISPGCRGTSSRNPLPRMCTT